MGDILIRTVFMGKGNDGIFRLSDWCGVITSLGAMMEPFNLNRGDVAGNDFSWSDPANRIDRIETYEPTGTTWGDNTIGGPLIPVQGY